MRCHGTGEEWSIQYGATYIIQLFIRRNYWRYTSEAILNICRIRVCVCVVHDDKCEPWALSHTVAAARTMYACVCAVCVSRARFVVRMCSRSRRLRRSIESRPGRHWLNDHIVNTYASVHAIAAYQRCRAAANRVTEKKSVSSTNIYCIYEPNENDAEKIKCIWWLCTTRSTVSRTVDRWHKSAAVNIWSSTGWARYVSRTHSQKKYLCMCIALDNLKISIT